MIPNQDELKYAQMKYARYYKIYDIVTVILVLVILIIPVLIICVRTGADTRTGFLSENAGDLIMLNVYIIIGVASIRKAIIAALWRAYDDVERISRRE